MLHCQTAAMMRSVRSANSIDLSPHVMLDASQAGSWHQQERLTFYIRSAVQEEVKRHVSRSVPVIRNRFQCKLGFRTDSVEGLSSSDMFHNGITRDSIL